MKNFLIPFNLADLSESALTYAISIGVKSKAKLFFYHATNSPVKGKREEYEKYIRKAYKELRVDFDDRSV